MNSISQFKVKYYEHLHRRYDTEWNSELEALNDRDLRESVDAIFDYVENEIEIRVESLKIQVDKVSESMENGLMKIAEICDKKRSINLLHEVTAKIDFEHPKQCFYKNVKQLERIVKKYNKLHRNKLSKLNRVKFLLNYSRLDKWLVGTIIHSFSRTFSKICYEKACKIPSAKSLAQVAYLRCKQQIVITDWQDECLKVVDLNGNFVGKYNANLRFFLPYAICISRKSEIFVAVQCLCSIVVLNANFEYVKEFSDTLIRTPFSMAIDDDLDHLYTTDYYNNIVCILDSDTGEFVNQLLIKKPKHIALNEENIFVISKNTINVIRKTPPEYEIIHKIELNHWYLPRSLHIDKIVYNENDSIMKLFTIAYNMDHNENISPTLYLFVITQTGFNCIQKTNLNITKLSDMLIIDKRLFVISDDQDAPLYIVDFE